MLQRRFTALAFVFALAVAASALPSGAHAQTAAQRAACEGDAYQFCSQYIPDHNLIRHCLARNIKRISRACRAQFRRR